MKRLATTIVVLGLAAVACRGREALGTPPDVAAISERISPFVEAREIAGAVTLVAEPEKVVHLAATGWADVVADRPMRPDSIFWVASMSKPITATAVLMMRDEGKLSIDDPVERFCPNSRNSGTPTANRFR